MSALPRALAAAALALIAGTTGAQTWPDKPIRLISVFPPGGSVDQVSRVLAQQLSKQLGQSVVVENIGGASGSIGTAAVAKAAPDGDHLRRRLRYARHEPEPDTQHLV